MKITVSFTLDSVRDADILRWLRGLPKRRRSGAIREALREHISTGGVSLGDVYQAIRDLEWKLEHATVKVRRGAEERGEWDEPPEAAAALDALAKM